MSDGKANEGILFGLLPRPGFRDGFMVVHGAAMLLGMFWLVLAWQDGDGLGPLATYMAAWAASVPLAWFASGVVDRARRSRAARVPVPAEAAA